MRTIIVAQDMRTCQREIRERQLDVRHTICISASSYRGYLRGIRYMDGDLLIEIPPHRLTTIQENINWSAIDRDLKLSGFKR